MTITIQAMFRFLMWSAAVFLMASASGLAWLQLDTWFHALIIFGVGFVLIGMEFMASQLADLSSAYYEIHFTDEGARRTPKFQRRLPHL